MKHPYLIILLCALVGCIAIKPSERISFDAKETYPEGIANDSIRNVFYVSSARLATIGKVDRNGNYSVLYNDSTLKSTYGLKLHPNGKLLMACVGDANYSKFTSADTRTKLARLIAIDVETGNKTMDIDLSTLVPGKHFINDLTFDDKGNMYLTDSFAHAVYKVDQAGKPSVFARDKQFETMGIGLNGIAYHPSGFLIVDNTNNGQLFKIPINEPKDVEKIQIDQYFLGADGLVLNDPMHLTMVVNGGSDKIYKLKSEDNWKSAKLTATTLAADRFTYPSTATLSKNEIWVMNARFNELLDSNSVPALRFAIQKAVFKPVPPPKGK